MKVAALCSAGKDSTLALWYALKQGHEVAKLVAMLPRVENSWMFHSQNVHLIDLFAECTRLPLVKAETSGVKEEELEDLKRVLRDLGVDGVVCGAVASTYQKSRIDRICRELGLVSIAPLWGREQAGLLREMLDAGFEIVVTSVSALGLDEAWLGRKLDGVALGELIELNRKYGVNLGGEGGEYETLVLDAPFFRARIELVDTECVWLGDRGHLVVKEARLVEK